MSQREIERQQAVHRFLALEYSKEVEIQELVKLAANICGTPTALITFIDHDTQYIKFKQAFDFETTLRKHSFCNYVVESEDVFMVPDALLDNRFINNPLVIGDPNIRFYAGAPLTTAEGHTLGSLCVIDKLPGILSENQLEMLKVLAKQVIHLMDLEASIKVIKDLYNDLKRSEIELRSFFESSIDHHLLLGRNFEILAFNKSWESHVLEAYGLQMAIGNDMTPYVRPDNLKNFFRDYNAALNGRVVVEERNLGYNDRDNWRLVKFEPAYHTDNKIIGVSINVADINKKVQHEMTVKAQYKQLHDIAVMQSHEFRKPVASILGLITLINMDGRVCDMEEWLMLEKAVKELDDKIRLIVGGIS